MPETKNYTISGFIFDEYNSALNKAQVSIFQVDLRSEKLLKTVITDDKGYYNYSFEFPTALPKSELKGPDIYIVIQNSGSRSIVGKSPVYFNIQSETTIDYRLDEGAILPINEFDRLVALLFPLLEVSKLTFDQLEETTDKNKDISFLSGETGEPFDVINALAQAHRLFVSTKIAPEIYYALLRMGFPEELSAILDIQSASISKAVEQAVKENIISSKFLKGLDSVIKDFNTHAVRQLKESKSEKLTTFKTLAKSVLPKDIDQETFLATWYENENEPEKFWESLKSKTGFNSGQTLENTKKLFEINTLTAGQPELAASLYKKINTDGNVGELSTLARLSAIDWEKEILSAKVNKFPEGITGETDKEKIANYAVSLEGLFKVLYPTTFFAERLKADPKTAFKNKANLDKFFTKNPTFDLTGIGILKALEQADFSGISDAEKVIVKENIKIVSRQTKLVGNNYAAVNALQGKQLHSASAIVKNYGKQQFTKDFAVVLGGKKQAEATYSKAVSLSNRAAGLLVATQMSNNIPLPVTHDTEIVDGQVVYKLADGYHQMFHDTELCDCEHCQSVYSPAAYFVDMLSCIRKEGLADANNDGVVYRKLMERRPDLELIELTCENTNTPLPYIDLVNELLEKEVKVRLIPDEVARVAARKHSFQTTEKPELLDALPEHRIDEAYNDLNTISASTAFNTQFPFDEPFEQIKLFTEKLDWNRYEFANLLNGADSRKYINVELAKAWFGVSQSTWHELSKEWAFNLSMPNNGKISELLRTMKITYIELLQLLETYFLNPQEGGERSLKIKQEGEDSQAITVITCNLDKLLLVGANDFWLQKAARFIRLWKITGWQLYDLDKAFTAFNPEEFPAADIFDDKVLLPLYHTELLKNRFKISTREALALLNNIETNTYRDNSKEGQPLIPSFYQDLFENKSLVVIPEPSEVDKLAAALETSVSEIIAIGISIVDDDESTRSIIYRNILLSKKLKLSVTELQALFGITGIELADASGWDAESLLHLSDEAAIVSAAKVLPSAFYTLLQSKTGEEHVYEISEGFVEFIANKKTEFVAIADVADLSDRNAQTLLKIEELINQFPDETNWTEDKTAISNDDKTVKQLVEGFTEIENQAMLRALTADSIIKKLEEVLRFVESYIKVPVIFKLFGFSVEKINWLKKNRNETDTAPLWNKNISSETTGIYEAYKKLFFFSRINKVDSRSTEKDWTLLFDEAINPIGTVENCQTLLAELYGLSEHSLAFTATKLNLNFPNDYKDAFKIFLLIDSAAAIEKLRASDEQLNALLNNEPHEAAAVSIQNLLKSKYSKEDWLKMLKPISDIMRKKRRDALVGWLIDENTEWKNATDIYKHLLIDTEMESCMDTSRIKQAIGSVQLFIDRCLMGLEPGLTIGDDFAKQWNDWRKQYRVWEANRKIFLYPENWIEPELRDDKSPFFKELESQLKQNEVTEETAKEALISYLQKLDNVAKLEMVGLFNDVETGILHVFGRTANIPHQYFYRTQFKNIWSAWEKVELDIDGDHILPVVWNGRLMLFWGQFKEKQKPNSNQKTTITGNTGANANMTMSSPAPEIYLEMKLAWSEYKKDKWSAKKISKEAMQLFWINKLVSLSLCSLINGNQLYIRLLNNYTQDKKAIIYLSFCFDACHSTALIEKSIVIEDTVTLVIPPGITSEQSFLNEITESNHDKLLLFKTGLFKSSNENNNYNVVELFGNTPGKFSLLPQQHEIEKTKADSFFYKNETSSFYVLVKEMIQHISPDAILPYDRMMARKEAFFDNSELPAKSAIGNKKSENPKEHSLSAGFAVPSLQKKIGTVQINSYNIFKGRRYNFQTFYHPYLCSYIRLLNARGIDSLYKSDVQNRTSEIIFTSTKYTPTELVSHPYPKEEVDFSKTGAYSLYNWELFYHIPLNIASQLMQNQKFEEARKWLHYIFNPTIAGNAEDGVKRFWITKPFREEVANLVSLEELLQKPEYVEDLAAQLDNWEDHPFNPHAVARFRISAYMRKTVLLYIDNLIKWGDQLFARDTIESINEATLMYVLAGEILGERKQKVPPRGKPIPKSFGGPEEQAIKDKLDVFNNALSDLETLIPAGNGNTNLLRMFYFCLPKNDYLLKYWDTVEDRLFKIRNCMNISGQVRSLALFEPPIDPAMLVRAASAGLSINDVLDNAVVLPHYRFQIILQKANELCNDVKVLGSQILSAIEKKDVETLSLLRSTHDLNMLGVIKGIKQLQKFEATEGLEGLMASKILTEGRMNYYKDKEFMNVSEKLYISSLATSGVFQGLAAGMEAYSGVLLATPDTMIGPFSAGFMTGGSYYGAAARANASILGIYASTANTIGAISSSIGNFQQRMDDWQFQAKTAELELKQIDKQIAAAEIRLAIAEQDLENHQLQTDQNREVDEYMRSKFSNAELYNWMVVQLSTIYFQSYKLAYSTAKKAERCMQHELGVENSNYIKFGYWDSLKQGLLSGETLQYDLRLLENAYLDQNMREMEITKHISLNMLDPFSIIELREKGDCTFNIPEVLFDMDFPGHYFRRLKSVSISIPCIAGPYTSVSATLALTKNSYRSNKVGTAKYVELPGTEQSIATSHGQNDSGMFELNFRDERYLPFENTGAISSWRLELPTEVKQFDYNTISDVIIHVKYTARDGGSSLKTLVNASLGEKMTLIKQGLSQTGLNVAINMKHDLPNEWHLMKQNGSIDLIIDKSRLPYMAQSIHASPKIEKVMFIAKLNNNPASFPLIIGDLDATINLLKADELDFYSGISENINKAVPFKLSISSEDLVNLEDFVMVLKYNFSISKS